MSIFKVAFASMQWENVRHGVRQKEYCEGARLIRLVEFATSEGFDDWCEAGHIGYVLAGGLEIDFNGKAVSFSVGDGLFIPPGTTTRHKALSIIRGTQLLMVEDAHT